MRGAVVREYGVEEFCVRSLDAAGLVQLIVFSHISTSEVTAAIRLSEYDHCTVIASCDAFTLIADCGEEIAHIQSAYRLGFGLRGGAPRCYQLSCGKIGVLVGDDVYFPEAARALALDGAKLFVVVGTIESMRTETLARAHAVANGVRLLYCGAKSGFAADYNGVTTNFATRVVSVECALTTESAMIRGLKQQ